MTDTKTLTLVEFLEARLAEDEAAADADAFPPPGYYGKDPMSQRVMALGLRALDEVEAKRAILKRCSAVDYAMPSTHLAHGILRHLAAIYSDHPDYRGDWKP